MVRPFKGLDKLIELMAAELFAELRGALDTGAGAAAALRARGELVPR